MIKYNSIFNNKQKIKMQDSHQINVKLDLKTVDFKFNNYKKSP